MHTYPQDTPVGIDDFRRCGWEAAINAPERDGYYGMSQALLKAAGQALDEGKTAEGKVLWLLSDACSMQLRPDSISEPFKPSVLMHYGRSALPQDFQSADIELFDQMSAEIADPWLKARLADLTWVLKKKYASAICAIDAYRQIPLDSETWLRGARECWERCMCLTRLLRGGAGTRMDEIETAFLGRIRSSDRSGAILALGLSQLLMAYGLARAYCMEIGEKLEAFARLLAGENKHYHAHPYFEAAIAWYTRNADRAKARQLTICIAEGFANEASAHNSRAVAAGLFEKAIQIYRTIPRAERAADGIEERISALHRDLSKAGEESLKEMKRISSEVDISDLVEKARNHVGGKPPMDALAAFANIHSGLRVTRLRQSCVTRLEQHPISGLFPASHLARDGRVIGKKPGMHRDHPDSEAALRSEMVRMYGMELGLWVNGLILPALETLILEHRLREDDFVSFAARSPVIPPGREQLFGKGLFLGYDLDFVGALHILVPQIENVVRCQLKAAGVKTTNLDQDGIENENGLSALVELPETARCFGEDLTFELNALFCDPFGPNLRNELAHGLLDFEACQSVPAVYAWWFGFRLMFKPFWHRHLRQDGAPPDSEGAGRVDPD